MAIREKKLRTILLEFVVSLGLMIILLVFLNYFLFFYRDKMIYPANYSEKLINENYGKIQEAGRVTEELFSPMSSFGVYDEGGHYLYGNFKAEEEDGIWLNYIRKERLEHNFFLSVVPREEEIVLVKYPVLAQYKSDWLRENLPNVEISSMVLVIIEILLGIAISANIFSKKINRELESLLRASKKIEEGQLDFQVEASNIKEINSVLDGIDKMKNSLEKSLEENWAAQQHKELEISALAHDIRTPLTIIKGNTELLQEENPGEEGRLYLSYIEEASRGIEGYLEELLILNQDQVYARGEEGKTPATSLIDSLKKQSQSLILSKNIELVWETEGLEGIYLPGEEKQLGRAIMNIIKNAFDYSEQERKIEIKTQILEGKFQIEVRDQGRGFSKEMLKRAKDLFATENTSRSQGKDHGLGLYISDRIITKLGGQIELGNNPDQGAWVKVYLDLVE